MTRQAKLGCMGGAMLLLAGCTGLHRTEGPVDVPQPADLVRALPQPVRNRIHVVFVHGHDPLDLASVSCLRKHLIELGLIKTYAGGPFHVGDLCDAAKESFANEPESRFVLVGHGVGCSSLAALASRMEANGMPIALAICLDPGRITAPGAGRVVHVVRGKVVPTGGEVHVVDAGPFHLTKDARVRELLARELAAVGQTVALMEPDRRGPLPVEGDWGFLGCNGGCSPRLLPIAAACEMGPATQD